jgi:hypothetical protein
VNIGKRLWYLAPLMAMCVLATSVSAATAGGAGIREVTRTAAGRAMVDRAAARHRAIGVVSSIADLHAWRLGPGDYLVGPYLPAGLETTLARAPHGGIRVGLSYQVSVASEAPAHGRLAATASPTWAWRAQACFSRIGDSFFGYIDACYLIHRLVGESDARDYYKLEQYGTVGAGWVRKIYNGTLSAVKGPGSGTMRWVDWSPRGDLSGSCTGIPLSVSALGVSINASGVMCEHWNITKGSDPGTFRESWECGCVWPLGQPAPNDREIDYMQAVSVPNGKPAIWTLSAAYTAI